MLGTPSKLPLDMSKSEDITDSPVTTTDMTAQTSAAVTTTSIQEANTSVATSSNAKPLTTINEQAVNLEPRVTKGSMPTLIMGTWEETYKGSGVFNALVGGRPKPDWSGLDKDQPYRAIQGSHYRPIDPIKRIKGAAYRAAGLETKFSKGHSINKFQRDVWDHLVTHGLDTIAYLKDPFTSSTMINVIENHPRFCHNHENAVILSKEGMKHFDQWDKENDANARQFLINSLDDNILEAIKHQLQPEFSFTTVWLYLIHHVITASSARFDDIKSTIRSMSPLQYEAQNITLLANDYIDKFNELESGGQMDYNLITSVLQSFHSADGPEIYKFSLLHLETKADSAISTVAFMSSEEKDTYMRNQKLDIQSICNIATAGYRKARDNNQWGPLKQVRDRRGVPHASTMAVTLLDGSKAFALTPVPYTPKSNRKELICWNCGAKGHSKRECTKPDTGTNKFKPGGYGGGPKRNMHTAATKVTNWKRVPPKKGDPEIKTVEGTKWKFCAKCRRWNPTHTTAEHVKKGTNNQDRRKVPSALLSVPHAMLYNISVCAPSMEGNDSVPVPFPPVVPVPPPRPPSRSLFTSPPPAPSLNTSSSPKWYLWLLFAYLTVVLGYFFFGLLGMQSIIQFGLSIIQFYETSVNMTNFWYFTKYSTGPLLYFLAGSGVHHLYHVQSTKTKVTNETLCNSRIDRKTERFDRKLKGRNLYSSNRNHWSSLQRRYQRQAPLRMRKKGLHYQHHQSAPTFEQRDLDQAWTDFFNKTFFNINDRLTKPHHRTKPTRYGKPRRKSDPTSLVYGSAGMIPTKGMQHALFKASADLQIKYGNSIPFFDNDPMALKAALTAPNRFRNAVGDSNVFDVVWDSGASLSVTNDRRDFTSFKPLRIPVVTVGRTDTKTSGIGIVKYDVINTNGELHTITSKAFYIPQASEKLLSITDVLSKLPGGSLHMDRNHAVLKAPSIGRLEIKNNPTTNLPTSQAFRPEGAQAALMNLRSSITTASLANMNLSQSDKEVIRWHCRFGHINLRRVQHIMRSGILATSEALRKLHKAGCKATIRHPYCASCLFGKQTRRPAPGSTRTVNKVRDGIMKQDHLLPGQATSIDHFECHSKGRLFSGYGKNDDDQKFCGGALFVDHASGYVHVEFQRGHSSHETVESVIKFEKQCQDFGVIPQKFITDSGSNYTAKEFRQHLESFHQVHRLAGVGAHHHNGIAERNIRTIMTMARTMMLHSAVHWPDVTDTSLWPMAVNHAVFLHNHLPSESTGFSPHDVFSKTRWPVKYLHDLHVWGCPIYVLEKRIADGKSLPKWRARSTRHKYVGVSHQHSHCVPLVLNLDTGKISAQYNVVFDDWFATVNSATTDLPDFHSDEWMMMFGDRDFQFVPQNDDNIQLEGATDLAPCARSSRVHDLHNRVSTAFDSHLRLNAQPLRPPAPSAPPLPNPSVRLDVPPPTTTPYVSDPLAVPGSPVNPAFSAGREGHTGNTSTSFPTSTPSDVPKPSPSLPVQSSSPKPVATTSSKIIKASSTPSLRSTKTKSPKKITVPAQPRRSTRNRSSPQRLTVSSTSEKSYSVNMLMGLTSHFASTLAPSDYSLQVNQVSKSKAKGKAANPDIFTYDQAMTDGDKVPQWREAMVQEINQLEEKEVWDIVPISEPQEKKEQIVPSTWTLRYKRAPDGTIKKMKARMCMRGDLQISDEASFSPVVSFATVRLFLSVALTLDWTTCSIDFSNAFVQAKLKRPAYMHLPRGFAPEDEQQDVKYCLKLKRSLYGSTFAPRLWYEHLFKFLLTDGFKQSEYDKCLLYKSTMMVIVYVDDAGIACKESDDIDKLIQRLEGAGFSLTKEGSFTEYLGIQYSKDDDGNIVMKQEGLIDKIVTAANMKECNSVATPATKEALAKDEEGKIMDDEWNYRSIVGMLLYLSNNTRPDLTFAVSQVARFCYAPKASHAAAVKRIVRYLKGSKDKGTIFKKPDTFDLKCYVDADFCGLYNRDPPEDSSSVKSRTGYIISAGGCFLVAKSQLQTTIALSTGEAEYYALSQAMRALLPIRSLLMEMIGFIQLPKDLKQCAENLQTYAYEDNSSALALATNQHVTSRTRHYAVKWHFFWSHVKTPTNPDGEVIFEKIATDLQKADYLTKGLVKDVFVNCRKLNQGW